MDFIINQSNVYAHDLGDGKAEINGCIFTGKECRIGGGEIVIDGEVAALLDVNTGIVTKFVGEA